MRCANGDGDASSKHFARPSGTAPGPYHVKTSALLACPRRAGCTGRAASSRTGAMARPGSAATTIAMRIAQRIAARIADIECPHQWAVPNRVAPPVAIGRLWPGHEQRSLRRVDGVGKTKSSAVRARVDPLRTGRLARRGPAGIRHAGIAQRAPGTYMMGLDAQANRALAGGPTNFPSGRASARDRPIGGIAVQRKLPAPVSAPWLR